MTQYFNDIKVSDKGMVKLIRNDGKDYIFPASKISDVSRAVDEIAPRNPFPSSSNSGFIFGLMDAVLSVTSDRYRDAVETEEREKQQVVDSEATLYLCVDGEDIYVDVKYSYGLASKITDAINYSNNRYKSKYGTFS